MTLANSIVCGLVSVLILYISGGASAEETSDPQPCPLNQQFEKSTITHLGSRAEALYEFACLPVPNEEFEFVLSFDILRDLKHVDGAASQTVHHICNSLQLIKNDEVDLVYIEYLDEGMEQINFRHAGICCLYNGYAPEKCQQVLEQRSLNG